jgi:hypothetical protein
MTFVGGRGDGLAVNDGRAVGRELEGEGSLEWPHNNSGRAQLSWKNFASQVRHIKQGVTLVARNMHVR